MFARYICDRVQTDRWRCDECECRRGCWVVRDADGSRRRSRILVDVVRLNWPTSVCLAPADGQHPHPAVARHGSPTPTGHGKHRSEEGWRRLTPEWRTTSSCSVCSRITSHSPQRRIHRDILILTTTQRCQYTVFYFYRHTIALFRICGQTNITIMRPSLWAALNVAPVRLSVWRPVTPIFSK